MVRRRAGCCRRRSNGAGRHLADKLPDPGVCGPWPPRAVAELLGHALQVLPDILRYDRTVPAAYPNGRGLTDAVYNVRYAWLSNGKIPPSGLKPHDDLLDRFPYLGPPHP